MVMAPMGTKMPPGSDSNDEFPDPAEPVPVALVPDDDDEPVPAYHEGEPDANPPLPEPEVDDVPPPLANGATAFVRPKLYVNDDDPPDAEDVEGSVYVDCSVNDMLPDSVAVPFGL